MKHEEQRDAAEEKEKAACANITTGSRCQVKVVGQPTKLGTVMYVGKHTELSFRLNFFFEELLKHFFRNIWYRCALQMNTVHN